VAAAGVDPVLQQHHGNFAELLRDFESDNQTIA
jgi:hypothetical protein